MAVVAHLHLAATDGRHIHCSPEAIAKGRTVRPKLALLRLKQVAVVAIVAALDWQILKTLRRATAGHFDC